MDLVDASSERKLSRERVIGLKVCSVQGVIDGLNFEAGAVRVGEALALIPPPDFSLPVRAGFLG